MRHWSNYVRYRTKEAFVVAAVFFSCACILQMFHVPPLQVAEPNNPENYMRIHPHLFDDGVDDNTVLRFEPPVDPKLVETSTNIVPLVGLQELPQRLAANMDYERDLFEFRIQPWRITGSAGLESTRNTQGNTFTGPYMRGAVVFLVFSNIDHVIRRRLLRATWGSIRDLESWKIELVFVVAESIGDVKQSSIVTENGIYGDILQYKGDEKSPTFKRLAGLQWAGNNLPWDFHVVFTSDDVMVNLPYVMDYIRSAYPTSLPPSSIIVTEVEGGGTIVTSQPQIMLCFGDYKESESTKRDGSSGSVNMTLYSAMKWPPYCSGGLVAMPTTLAKDIFMTSRRTELQLPQNLYDVIITGILRRKLGRGDTNLLNTRKIFSEKFENLPINSGSKMTSLELQAEAQAEVTWQEWYSRMRYRSHIYSLYAIR
uniref:Hexosyltransferase n=1 Tax=Ciona savignyi TaxID=51511 RepID=H2YFX8_CIOSA